MIQAFVLTLTGSGADPKHFYLIEKVGSILSASMPDIK